jgi:23S rRNA pseudouridine2457 synthase
MILLFNKPFQVMSQFSSEGDKKTLAEFIDIPRVYPAGRLDYDSEGLMLLTDDGKVQNQIASPKFNKKKVYWAQVEGIPSNEDIAPLKKGVKIQDYITKPAKVAIIEEPQGLWERVPPIRFRKNSPTSWLQIEISEGKNRQVRKMTAAIGFPTLRLIRAQIAHYKIDDLPLGQYKVIDE